MGQLEDLKAATDTLDADIAALVAGQTQAFTDLEAATKTGTATVPDLQPIIDRLTANHAALVQALADAQAADATTKTPPPPATGV